LSDLFSKQNIDLKNIKVQSFPTDEIFFMSRFCKLEINWTSQATSFV
jgi:hypothetical protein